MEPNKKPASTGESSGPQLQQKSDLTNTNYTALKQYVELLERDNDLLGRGYETLLVEFCDLLKSQGPAWSAWLIQNRFRHRLPESVMDDIRRILNLPLDMEDAV